MFSPSRSHSHFPFLCCIHLYEFRHIQKICSFSFSMCGWMYGRKMKHFMFFSRFFTPVVHSFIHSFSCSICLFVLFSHSLRSRIERCLSVFFLIVYSIHWFNGFDSLITSIKSKSSLTAKTELVSFGLTMSSQRIKWNNYY